MKKSKELNNKGFSLVELLIATVILGIVVAPLLHTFVTAASTTARSRQMGDATLASKNIAETVEATSLSELFNAPDISDYFEGATSKAFYSLDSGVYTPLAADASATAPYHFGVQGLKAGGSTFNAMITFDPSPYRAGNPTHKPINDIKITDYSNMDAVYAQSRDADDPDELAWASFSVNASSSYSDWDRTSAEPVRTMTLRITKDAANKIYATLVMNYSYTFLYTVWNEEEQKYVSDYATLSAAPISYDLMPQGYSLTANGNVLPNLYLMYYPLYEDDGDTNDIIRIENNAALPFKIFLVKERGDDLSGELQYHASVEQYVPSGTPSNQYAVIYSNIREDLSNDANHAALPGVSYRIYRGNYFSVTGHFEGEHGDLVSKSARSRMYETTVEIYASNDTTFSNPLHTFRSTKLSTELQ